MIREVFSHLKFQDEKIFRADSAFCNQESVEECVRVGAKFTITAHGNIGWEQKAISLADWTEWEWSLEELKALLHNGWDGVFRLFIITGGMSFSARI